MQLPQLRMQQTYAQIGLKTIKPVQEIEQPPADLSIKQVPAKMNIDRKPSHLEINQDQAWNELGFKNLGQLTSDHADYSKQEGLEAIARIAQEGDQLAAIERKGDPITSIAAQKANPEPADFNIAFIPSYGSVQIQFTPAELKIDWNLGKPEIDATLHEPIHRYTPGRTEVYLRQMQQLQIEVIGGNLDNKS